MGRISGLFGVHGWMKVFSETSPRTNILDYDSWYLSIKGEWKEYRLEGGHAQGRGVVVSLEGFGDRDQAAELLGAEIAVSRQQMPVTGEEEYYWTDLEGARIITLDGIDLGRVERLFSTGSNDVMVVRGGRERLIPFVDGTVVKVDLEQGLITVDWDPEF